MSSSAFNPRLRLWFSLSAVVSLMLAVVLYIAMSSTARKSALVEQSQDVLHGLRSAMAKYDEAIVSVRGFARSNDPAFIDLYQTAMRQVKESFDRVSSLTGFEPGDRLRMERLRQLIADREAVIDGMLRVQKADSLQSALRYGSEHGLDRLVAQIWAVLSEMETEQKRQLSERVKMVSRASRITFGFFAVGMAGNLVIIALAFLYMARQVSERVAAEAGLRAAKEAAEAANRAKGQFLANMSHEIRTPMNGILGMTELALDTELTAEQSEYLRLVKSSADALLIVINDILDFSKIDAGKMELSPTEFAFRGLVEETVRALNVKARGKGLSLECAIAAEIPETLVGDSGRLRQIIVNLVGNSIKFTNRGGIVVRANLERRDETAGTVDIQFSIADTGIGINPEKLAKVFEPFEQEDNSTTRRFGGTGLGLAISSKLVALMGGTIWVESELGSGSTFHFTARFQPVESVKDISSALVLLDRSRELPSPSRLDRGKLNGEPAPEAASRGPSRGLPAPDPRCRGVEVRKRLKVLLAEDHVINQMLVTRLLETAGHEVKVVENGLLAVDAVTEGSFDVVLMDLQMPVMGGFEAIARIRAMADEKKRRVLSIALTAHAMKGDRERCLAAGFDEYLSKPVNPRTLAETMATCLDAAAEATVRMPPRA